MGTFADGGGNSDPVSVLAGKLDVEGSDQASGREFPGDQGRATENDAQPVNGRLDGGN